MAAIVYFPYLLHLYLIRGYFPEKSRLDILRKIFITGRLQIDYNLKFMGTVFGIY
jgi:hypothetical protein